MTGAARSSGEGPAGVAETALAQASWQPVLLADRPRRLDLLRLQPRWPLTTRTVQVHRNHGFDVVTSAWRPFCAFAGLDVAALMGPYDDSLDLDRLQNPVDLHVVSLDFERYRPRMSGADLVSWLLGRVRELTRRSSAPVLLTNDPSPDAGTFNDQLARAADALPDVFVADVAAIGRELGAGFLDHRLSGVAGTSWSAAAAVAVAREFGLRWLPGLLSPPVKAVVVDLDGTLYDGVLGEDGPEGVRLTDAHAALQEHLVQLRRRGVFIGVVSRNEAADVDALFRSRTDFPLTWDMVSAAAVDWTSKADGVADVAAQLRIGTDAIAFLDDNPGELATVASAHPGVRTLHAADASSSLRALVHCPGLFRFRTTDDDARRVDDLRAARERAAQVQAASDPEDYLRSLRVELDCRVNQPGDVPRAAQLSQRTNQFTTSVMRISEGELLRRRREGSLSFVVVALKDRLADSGTVAVVFGHQEGRRLVVEGVSISCRALGRRIETAVVESAVALLAGDDVDEVAFLHATGERNGPALEWLAGYTGRALGADGIAVVDWDARVVRSRAGERPVSITVVGEKDDD
ncbi:HAD-IIIC family phosphatase [Blastococcus litoris]|uniref:HAD-IIIC family phosphatase n=1 Tax=Blastococcus litoris TaxID=2171622 RepID=UPI000E2FF98C|nr:HAD-IIIC family phosphatase [Blastococcus litoris]